MTDNLHDHIVSIIPSSSLKEAIKATGFRLSDEGMAVTAFHYAPDFNSRLGMLKELEQRTAGELKAYIARLIDTQYRMYEEFMSDSDGSVFEVHIKISPDSYDERYLCSTYHAALKMIPLFLHEYSCIPNDSTRYTIVKRRIFSAESGEVFSEDNLGEMVLLPDLSVFSVNLYKYEHHAEECNGQCINCNRCCVSCYELLFPNFTNHGDVVSFSENISGTKEYGIVYHFGAQQDSDCYIIPIDSYMVRYRDFENIHNSHRHIPLPTVEKITVNELPDSLKEDYIACKAYFDEIE